MTIRYEPGMIVYHPASLELAGAVRKVGPPSASRTGSVARTAVVESSLVRPSGDGGRITAGSTSAKLPKASISIAGPPEMKAIAVLIAVRGYRALENAGDDGLRVEGIVCE